MDPSASAGASPCRPSPVRPTRACPNIATPRSQTFISSPAPKTWYRFSSRTAEVRGCHHRARYTIHRYRPRIEGLFARIERWTNQATGEIHWRSITRDNVTTLYGKTAENRIAASDDPKRIFTWLICESYDDKGNAIIYKYAAENNENIDRTANERNRVRTANRYVKRIQYGNQVSRLIQPDLTQTKWMFEVAFDYDEGHYEVLPLDPPGLKPSSIGLSALQQHQICPGTHRSVPGQSSGPLLSPPRWVRGAHLPPLSPHTHVPPLRRAGKRANPRAVHRVCIQ